MKNVIFFNSYVYTVKSVYRKKLRDGTFRVHLRVLEEDKKFIFDINDRSKYKFLKRDATITVHIGNGGYICIEKGKKVPEGEKIYSAEIKYLNTKNK